MITEKEYYNEINSIAALVREEYEPEDYDQALDALNQVLEGHEYVIYYRKAYEVLGISRNYDAFFDLGLDCGLRVDNFLGLCTTLAYWAMYEDIMQSESWGELEGELN